MVQYIQYVHKAIESILHCIKLDSNIIVLKREHSQQPKIEKMESLIIENQFFGVMEKESKLGFGSVCID